MLRESGSPAACGHSHLVASLRGPWGKYLTEYLILLASPEAARYPWIAKEVEYWLEHKSPDRLFIGLTDGELAWDGSAN